MNLMEFSQLFSLLQYTDETARIEAKEARTQIGSSFLETVSAFSNEPGLDGGYILLGISRNEEALEPRYLVTGVQNPDHIQQQVASLCSQSFNSVIRPIILTIPHPDGTVILVYIPEAKVHEKPVYIKSKGIEKGAYRRIGSTDQVCNSEDLDLLYQLRSNQKFDETAVLQASLDDFDSQAIRTYRIMRKQIKPKAVELTYTDVDLLAALQATVTEKGVVYPTVAGLLLFGNVGVLNRLFSMKSRIDYLLVQGTTWVSNPDRRYIAIEFCEPLLLAFPRVVNQVMNDIPKIFSLDKKTFRRVDIPILPEAVVREAIVNAIMHRDYRTSSSLQIIKYANRIEFRNPGSSLKPHEKMGMPGSCPRNNILTKVFRDINYAETKGTGLNSMREEMQKAHYCVPLIESDRSANYFSVTLLPHVLFDKKDRNWLDTFKEFNLTSEEARALIVLREMGAITYADYQTINFVDPFVASFRLKRLRDLGLIEQKGRGDTTYYIPSDKLLEFYQNSDNDVILPGKLDPLPGKLDSLPGKLDPLPGKLDSLPGKLDSLPGKLDPLPGKLDSLPGKLDPLPGKLDSLPGKLDSLPGKLDPLPGKLDPLPGKLDPLPGKLDSLPGKLDPLPGKLDSLPGKLDSLPGKLDSLPILLPVALVKKLDKLQKRTPPDQVKSIIRELCSIQPCTASQIAHYLKRSLKYVRNEYLIPMLGHEELALLYPDQLTSPAQAYMTIMENKKSKATLKKKDSKSAHKHQSDTT